MASVRRTSRNAEPCAGLSEALQALDGEAPNWEAIDQRALEAIDIEEEKRQPGTLRERVARQIEKAERLPQ